MLLMCERLQEKVCCKLGSQDIYCTATKIKGTQLKPPVDLLWNDDFSFIFICLSDSDIFTYDFMSGFIWVFKLSPCLCKHSHLQAALSSCLHWKRNRRTPEMTLPSRHSVFCWAKIIKHWVQQKQAEFIKLPGFIKRWTDKPVIT